MSDTPDGESGPMVDAVNTHVLDHLVNGPAAHRALMDAAITADRRAEAAEARAARLAAALRDTPCCCYYRWSGDPPVERRVTCNRCAALADSGEA